MYQRGIHGVSQFNDVIQTCPNRPVTTVRKILHFCYILASVVQGWVTTGWALPCILVFVNIKGQHLERLEFTCTLYSLYSARPILVYYLVLCVSSCLSGIVHNAIWCNLPGFRPHAPQLLAVYTKPFYFSTLKTSDNCVRTLSSYKAQHTKAYNSVCIQ